MRLRKRTAGRLGWAFADQAISSLSNLLVGVLVARAVSAEAFGAFAIVLTAYWLALGASRSLASEPFLVRVSTTPDSKARASLRAAGGTAVVVGLVTGAVCAAAALAVGGPLRYPLLAVGVTMPGLLLQDFFRYSFFARGRGQFAFAADLLWAVLLFSALAGLLWAGKQSVGLFVLIWGLTASVAALFSAAKTRIAPNPLLAPDWLREHRDLAPRFLGEFSAMNGAGQLSLYLIGAIAGLASVGALRGGQILLGPLNVLFLGIWLFAVAEGVRLLEASPARLRHAARLLSFGLCSAALAWASLVTLLPTSLGTLLLGDSWAGAHEVVFVVGLAMAGTGAATGAVAGLRSLAAAQRSLRVRLTITPLTVLGAVVGAAVAGALGGAAGIAAAAWLGVVLWWVEFRRALDERDISVRLEAEPVVTRELPLPSRTFQA